MLNVAIDDFLDVERLGPLMVNGQHVDAEGRFKLSVLVEIVDHDLGNGIPFELNDQAGVFIGFVPEAGNLCQNLFIDQLSNTFFKHRSVDVEGDLGDDDLLPARGGGFNLHATPNAKAAPARMEILADGIQPADLTSAREVRALDVFHEFRNGDRRLVDLCADSIDDLSQVVRRNVGRHANSDAGATIDQ